jgi:hypothetical protein
MSKSIFYNVRMYAGLMFAVAFFMTANAKADLFEFTFTIVGSKENQSAVDGISFIAADNGGGITFTFNSTWDQGKYDGPGSVLKDEVFLYNVGDVFDTSGLKVGGGLKAGQGWWNEAAYTAYITPGPESGYYNGGGNFIGSTLNGGYFTLDYAEGAGWLDFLALMSSENPFSVGAHFYNLNGNYSASAQAVSKGEVPEPATLALFGLGLAGLGVVRARRKK